MTDDTTFGARQFTNCNIYLNTEHLYSWYTRENIHNKKQQVEKTKSLVHQK